jgi:hypothetical protein
MLHECHVLVTRLSGPTRASTVISVRLWTGHPARSQGALAQLVARFHGMEEVRGSSPLSSTVKPLVRPPLSSWSRPSGWSAWLLLTNLLTNVRAPLIVGEEQIHRDGSARQHRT